MESMIQIKNLVKEFHMGENVIKAVNDVSFTVEEGEMVRISGRSGSGKSTLLNLMAGLDDVTEGEIIIADNHIEKLNELERIRFRRKYVGFIFQSYNLLPQFTALENVIIPLALLGVPKKDRAERALHSMELVGVETLADHKPMEMSGGQQQRVGIARAIVANPPIVFADEPTGNLDYQTSIEVMELLTGLFEKRGTTFIIVSHDEDTKKYIRRNIELFDGKILRDEGESAYESH